MKPKTIAKRILTTSTGVHRKTYEMVSDLREMLVANVGSMKDLTDVAFALKKSATCFEDARKEVTKLSELAQTACCAKAIAKNHADTIRGEWASATVNMTPSPTIPSPARDWDAYAKVCEFFGIQPSEMTRLHWPSVCERVKLLMERGERVPEELLKNDRMRFSLTMRAKGDK